MLTSQHLFETIKQQFGGLSNENEQDQPVSVSLATVSNSINFIFQIMAKFLMQTGLHGK